MSKLTEIKQKISEKLTPIREKLFKKSGGDAEGKPGRANPFYQLKATYTNGNTEDRVIVLLIVVALIFGVFSFYKVGMSLVSRKELIDALLTKDRDESFNKMEAYLRREAETRKAIGSTVSLNQIKINYTKDSGDTGFISLSIWVRCDDPKTAKIVEYEYPRFQDAIISSIQNVREAEITSERGKKAIQKKMLLALNSALHTGKVEEIYFHNMVYE